jgi:hypothetical protein
MQHSILLANLPFKIQMREIYLAMNKLSGEGYLHVFKLDMRQAVHKYTVLRVGQQLSAMPYRLTNIPKLVYIHL